MMMPTMEAIGNAIRLARGNVSQSVLADRIPAEASLPQPAISELENGHRLPTLDQMIAIEVAANVAPGFILRAAGYIPDPSTRWAIETEGTLSAESRRSILAAFDASTQRVD